MAGVAVITDSTVGLPEALLREYSIHVVPMMLVIEGKTYRDGLDIAPGQFYELLKKADRLPTTSPSSPGTYLDVYRKAAEQAQAILCITVSSRVSAMYDSARLAKTMAAQLLPNTVVEVMDSGTAGFAEGFIVLEAARAAARGQTLEEVVRVAEAMKPRVSLVAVLDTFYYLAKGGRVPWVAAWAGSLLQIKPILELAAGEVKLLERPRTRARALQRLLAIMGGRVGFRPAHVAILHAGAPEEAERLRQKVVQQFVCRELFVSEFTPVMGAHTGPGLLGLAFWAGEEGDGGS